MNPFKTPKVAPPPPDPEPVPMPATADDREIETKRKARQEAQGRKGRSSTLLSSQTASRSASAGGDSYAKTLLG